MAKVAHASASAEETAPDIMPLSLPPQRGWVRGFGRAASAVLVVTLFWALFTRMTDFREVIDIGRDEIGWWEGAALVIMTTLSLIMSFAAMVAALPGLRWRDAAHINLTTTAVAYGVPGGGAAATALTVTMLRSLGFGRGAITLEVLSTGVWNGAVKVGLPLVALVMLVVGGDQAGWLVAAAVSAALAMVVGIGLVWAFSRDERVAAGLGRATQRLVDGVGRLVGRSPAGDVERALVRFRADAGGLVKTRGWALSAATVGYHLSLFGVLLVSLAALDVKGVSVFEALAVFAVARQVTVIPVTPGGVGVMELGLVGGLNLFGGEAAAATAAVLVYRGITYWIYLPAGLPLWAAWRVRTNVHPEAPVEPVAAAFPVRYYRHPGDVIRLFGGLGAVVVLGVFAAGGRVLQVEVDLFRVINDLPAAVAGPVKVVMQAGWLGAVPLAGAAALALRRRRLALDLVAGGFGAWLAAKGVKAIFHRARPGAILGDVLLRGVKEGGHGFVSGHAAVAAALATVAAGNVSRRVRWAAWFGVWAVAAARVYVGAHLPLDVIGGAALGWAVGGVVHLARGTPDHVPTPEEVSRALAAAGYPVTAVERVHADARGSIPYRAFTPDQPLFVKAVGRDQRDADVLYKLCRFLAFRETGDEAPFSSPKRQLEHEAFLAVLADRAGARVPAVVVTTDTGGGVWLEAQQLLDAVPLNSLNPAEVGDALLDDLWTQVARLQEARLVHRDLRAANVMVDPDGRPWLVDWGFAEAGATDRLLAVDVAELLAATACLVGPERAVDAATRALGGDTLTATARLLQPLALSAGTRRDVLGHPGLLQELRVALGERDGVSVGREKLVRLPLRPGVVGAAALAAWALHHLVTRVAGVGELVDVVGVGSWRWLLLGALAAASGYVAAAAALMAAVPIRLPLGRTTAVQLAAGFASKMTPPGQGSLAVVTRYLHAAGLDPVEADQAVRRTRAAGLAVHVTALTVSWALLARSSFHSSALPGGWVVLVAVVVALSVLGAVLWQPLRRGPGIRAALGDLWALPTDLRAHTRAVPLFVGAAGVTAARVAALDAGLWAFGAKPSLLVVAGVYLAVAAIAPLGPLPGGLGVVEAGLVVGLSALGVPAAPAVAGILAYRLLTFWAPIIPAAFAYRRLRCQGCC